MPTINVGQILDMRLEGPAILRQKSVQAPKKNLSTEHRIHTTTSGKDINVYPNGDEEA